MYEVYTTVLGIPCVARFNVDPAEPGVGLMQPAMEDLTFHNVKNGSELKWLAAKLDKASPAEQARTKAAIWAAFDKQADERY